MYMLADYATFNIANIIAFDKINYPEIKMLVQGAAISLIAFGICGLKKYIINKKQIDISIE